MKVVLYNVSVFFSRSISICSEAADCVYIVIYSFFVMFMVCYNIMAADVYGNHKSTIFLVWTSCGSWKREIFKTKKKKSWKKVVYVVFTTRLLITKQNVLSVINLDLIFKAAFNVLFKIQIRLRSCLKPTEVKKKLFLSSRDIRKLFICVLILKGKEIVVSRKIMMVEYIMYIS
ncbi:hypothetical protein BD770DRAFT_424260 [Pilaira anomala]|nr:hypothetical protein BD770DRAFT_424260 [Pilaira anomala]